MKMNVHNLGQRYSVFSQFMAEIRDIQIQKDRMRFRRNLERVGEIMAYEISKTLKYHHKSVTPLWGSPNAVYWMSSPL